MSLPPAFGVPSNRAGEKQQPPPAPVRDPAPMLRAVLDAWNDSGDLWLFGYGSLIWRPDFDCVEQRPAQVYGWHRALRMWSRVNRGTPETPGLVFAMLSGGSCKGVAFRIAQAKAKGVLTALWEREMVTGVYDPKWVRCKTPSGDATALAFTLPRTSPNYAADLTEDDYRRIFATATGRYGATRDYATQTQTALRRLGIHDRALEQILKL